VSETIVVNGAFDGGGQIFRAGAQMTVPLFDVQSGSLANCTVVGHGVGYGVLVTGSDTTIEDVTVSQFARAFEVENCARVTLTNCKARYCTQFGFNAEYADTVVFQNCDSQYHGLDGFKLRAKATHITLTTCYAAHNGQDPVNAGDGVDVFAGGDGVLIENCTFENNQGNGITIKTDTLTRDEPLVYGVVQNITVRGCTCRNNTGWGIIAISGFVPDVPLLRGVTIENVTAQDNVMDGLWVNAGDVTVDGLTATPNGRYGVLVDTRAEAVLLTNVTGDVVDLR